MHILLNHTIKRKKNPKSLKNYLCERKETNENFLQAFHLQGVIINQ